VNTEPDTIEFDDLKTVPDREAAQALGFRDVRHFRRIWQGAGFKTFMPSPRKRTVLTGDVANFLAQKIEQSDLQPQPGPGVAQELADLKQQVAETSNRLTARETAEAEAREEALRQSIEKYAEGKDYWPEIKEEVWRQVAALRAADENRFLGDPIGALGQAEQIALGKLKLPQPRKESGNAKC
jgi:chorismate mutase